MTIMAIVAVVLIVAESESFFVLMMTKVVGFALGYAVYSMLPASVKSEWK